MVFNKLKDRRKTSGFTLVELLIVIVVIAILAAITIVAYGNVSARANTTQGQTAVANVVKIAEAINADDTKYPDLTTGTSSFTVGSTQGTAKLPSGITIAAPSGSGTVTATPTALSTIYGSSTAVFSAKPANGNTVVVVPVCSAAGVVLGGAVYGYSFADTSKVTVAYYGAVDGTTTIRTTGGYNTTVNVTGATHC